MTAEITNEHRELARALRLQYLEDEDEGVAQALADAEARGERRAEEPMDPDKQRCPRCSSYRPSLVTENGETRCASCLVDEVRELRRARAIDAAREEEREKLAAAQVAWKETLVAHHEEGRRVALEEHVAWLACSGHPKAAKALVDAETEPEASAPGDWPEDFKGENGQYQNRCVKCDQLLDSLVHEKAFAHKAQGDLLTEVDRLRERLAEWEFVPDENGGHYLSVPTGDKWYPETFTERRLAGQIRSNERARAQIIALQTRNDRLAEALRLAVPTIEDLADQQAMSDPFYEPALEAARAALAKARGSDE